MIIPRLGLTLYFFFSLSLSIVQFSWVGKESKEEEVSCKHNQAEVLKEARKKKKKKKRKYSFPQSGHKLAGKTKSKAKNTAMN